MATIYSDHKKFFTFDLGKLHGDPEKEGGRYMDVVTVKVEGGTDKCVGAVNWKLRWEAREIKEKGKQGGDDEKMKKLLGLR